MRRWLLYLLFLTCFSAFGQEDKSHVGIFFPKQLDKHISSLGLLLTTTNTAITEELQFRIPALDYHYANDLSGKVHLSGRAIVQGLQNHLSGGIQYRFGWGKYRCAFGDDFAYWFGYFNSEGFKSRGNGVLNYPSFSIGREFSDQIFVTFKSELILNLGYKTFVSNNLSASNHQLFNGQRFSIVMEQPFYNNQWFMLGFGFLYVDLYWQTWILYENFNRNSFYPQIMAGFIL